MPTVYMIANWKMHGSLEAVKGFLHDLDTALWQLPAHASVIFCPPASHAYAALRAKSPGSRVAIGGQSISSHESGAHTGEISAGQLADIGLSHTLVGHSEDRAARGLSDADVAIQAARAMDAGLIPIICIGESQADYDAKRTLNVLDTQLAALQPAITRNLPFLIAYEPVWAIGSGKTPTLQEIEAVHAHIHAFLGQTKEPRDTAVAVLYGGSVKSTNAKEILALPSVNGALVGSASLQVNDFSAMVLTAAGVK